jgi:hypothetical protein
MKHDSPILLAIAKLISVSVITHTHIKYKTFADSKNGNKKIKSPRKILSHSGISMSDILIKTPTKIVSTINKT